ncbi:glycoside hydrolase family 78 protein [bacterium]|nr:glycoside hydrolase family 78 protein [bacterium]
MKWQAKWIWDKNEPSPRNFYWCARKTFDVPDKFGCINLHISADSRYNLWINGEYLGFGPVRAFTQNWRYDSYDITRYIKPGKNVIAVLVQHYGVDTFQYLDAPGGLVAQVNIDEHVAAATDSTWKTLCHPSYDRRTPRMACQQAWTEVFDARNEPFGWKEVGFDDFKWEQPAVIGEVGCEPWGNLLPRNIPFLTNTPVYPVRTISARTVKPPDSVCGINIRLIQYPQDKTANPVSMTGLVATVLNCSKGTNVKIRPFYSQYRAFRLDGADLDKEVASAGVNISAGEHLLVTDISVPYTHDSNFTLIIEGDGVKLQSPLGNDAPTPFAATCRLSSTDDPSFLHVWQAKKAEYLQSIPELRAVKLDELYEVNVIALTTDAPDTGAQVCITEPDAMLVDNDNVTTIAPSKSGDTEILLDFGRMTVGFLEIALDAPEGLIVDFNGFEYISNGKHQPTFSLNNTFRYIARSGWQTWRSVVRRGARYATLTLRFPKGCNTPVQFQTIKFYEHTYPYVEHGRFQCSDYKLNKIWDISRLTVRLCSEDTFVDCPTYEQTFWVGDARNESLFAYTAFGDYRLARRCLLLAGESMWRSPIVESQVPSGWEDILPAWSLLWAMGCTEHYHFTADKAFLEEVYPVIRQQNFNMRQMFTNKDGLYEMEDAWNLLDWAPMDTPRQGAMAHLSMLLCAVYRRSAKVAEILGKPDDAQLYIKWADELKAAINKHLWDEDKQAYIDCIHVDGTRSDVISQQTQTMAYLCDVVPEDKAALFKSYLIDVPDGWVRIGSPFMMAFTLEALDKSGDDAAAIELIRKWWGMMVDDGATTCWETFPGYFFEWPARSHCHAWSAAPAFALPSYVLGVRPLEPGFEKFEVRPFLGDLEWAKGIVPTPNGEIGIDLKRDGGKINLKLSVPDGTTAIVKENECSPGVHELIL